MIKRLWKLLLPWMVLAIALLIGVGLMKTAPEVKRQTPKPIIPVVEIRTVQPVEYAVLVPSHGTVAPHTQGSLVAEVAGRIIQVGSHFRPGGFFEAKEMLVAIEEEDYHHAVTIARADLLRMRLALREEEARAVQAKQDWKKLGLSGDPGALTLRGPQLEGAKAALAASEARLAQAERDLQRTKIVAPYAGRVLEKQVDVGQYVARGTPLATLYAVDHVEIRLPITDEQAAFLDLPEHFRGEEPRHTGPQVNLTATVGGNEWHWQGEIVRTEGSIDPRTRQLHVVARVDDPYHRDATGNPPLKVGQFVKAAIVGPPLKQVFIVPREALRPGSEVLVLTSQERIAHKKLQIIWRDKENVIVKSGLQAGDRVVLTPLPYAPDGMQVTIQNQTKPTKKSGKES